jgi:hypothetical protein
MTYLQDPGFERFVAQRRRKLQRIAYKTRGEHQFSDLVGEAWLIGQELMARNDVVPDFLDPSFQDLLLSHLYQHFIRYEEKNVRYAVRLDQAIEGAGQDDESHPLMYVLASDEGRDPLAEIIERETASLAYAKLGVQHCLASAYVRLLRLFDNRMPAVADHLLISISHSYRRCAKARLLAVCQHHLPIPPMERSFIPGPWRRFRLHRAAPVQLTFDFEDELPL